MRFRKFHGAGNDFVMLLDPRARMGPVGTLSRALVAALCDRHTGVGADGVIRILAAGGDAETAAAGAALRMDYYNADGGAAEMCGNGIRCLAVLAADQGLTDRTDQRVLTGAGVVTVRFPDDGDVAVDMGTPRLRCEDVPMTGTGPSGRVGVEVEPGLTLEGTGVSMGNPHFVLFASELGAAISDDLVGTLGPRLETHPAFPERTNVEFVEVLGRDEIRMRVWERGVGETLACGSGACAAAVASAVLDRTGRDIRVLVPGGALRTVWADDDHVWLTGPAEEVFAGEIGSDWLRARGIDAPTLAEAS